MTLLWSRDKQFPKTIIVLGKQIWDKVEAIGPSQNITFSWQNYDFVVISRQTISQDAMGSCQNITFPWQYYDFVVISRQAISQD